MSNEQTTWPELKSCLTRKEIEDYKRVFGGAPNSFSSVICNMALAYLHGRAAPDDAAAQAVAEYKSDGGEHYTAEQHLAFAKQMSGRMAAIGVSDDAAKEEWRKNNYAEAFSAGSAWAQQKITDLTTALDVLADQINNAAKAPPPDADALAERIFQEYVKEPAVTAKPFVEMRQWIRDALTGVQKLQDAQGSLAANDYQHVLERGNAPQPCNTALPEKMRSAEEWAYMLSTRGLEKADFRNLAIAIQQDALKSAADKSKFQIGFKSGDRDELITHLETTDAAVYPTHANSIMRMASKMLFVQDRAVLPEGWTIVNMDVLEDYHKIRASLRVLNDNMDSLLNEGKFPKKGRSRDEREATEMWWVGKYQMVRYTYGRLCGMYPIEWDNAYLNKKLSINEINNLIVKYQNQLFDRSYPVLSERAVRAKALEECEFICQNAQPNSSQWALAQAIRALIDHEASGDGA